MLTPFIGNGTSFTVSARQINPIHTVHQRPLHSSLKTFCTHVLIMFMLIFNVFNRNIVSGLRPYRAFFVAGASGIARCAMILTLTALGQTRSLIYIKTFLLSCTVHTN